MNNGFKIFLTIFMKQRALILFLAFLCTGSIQALFAQSLANYKTPNGNLVRTTGITYNSIEFTGNAVPSWRFTGAGAEDDDRSYPINIGFDFWYLGTRYTTFSVSTNGFIDFSSSTRDGGPATNQYGSTDNDLSQPSSATTRTMPLTIAPLYYDQTTDTSAGGLDALGNGLKYLTSGTIGNRVLTVEWIRTQPWYTGANGRPQFNYQVKLYEGTGTIEFVYGAMTIGSFSFAAQSVNIVQGYTSGMNGTTISTAPTAAEMLVQQTQNSTTFSNGGVNGGPTNAPHTLQTLPASNSSISFSPPVPTAPSNLTFPSVLQTSMQLQWSDSPDEYAYVIYRSDDGGASYNWITQLSAGVTTYSQTGLLSGTTYYWKIYAISEGALSTALAGSQATLPPGNDTSKVSVSGLWSDPLTWKSGVVPGTSSNVVIDDGTTVTIDQNVSVNSVAIGTGTSGVLQIGNNATARTVSVTGTIDVRSGGIFRVNTTSNTSAHVLNTTGNIQNSGTFDMSSDADSRATVNFVKSGTQSISGTGVTSRFYLITMNLGGIESNFLDVFATNFTSTTTNYLTLTSGTFNLATGVTTTPFTGNVTIPLIGGLRVNHSSAILNTTGGSLTVVGEVRVMSGTLNVGNASDNSLISNGGTFIFSGGAVNVAGRFDQANSYALTNLTMSGGILTVNTVGSTSTTSAPFTMNVAGSVFTMSSGSIIIQNPGNAGGQNLGFVNTTYTNYSITGGLIQIGNASTPAASTIKINSSIPVYNFVVNSSNVTAQLATNHLTILNNVTITLGTLDANALNMTVEGNWVNNGTFTPSTGKVTFNGFGSQSITDPSGENFYKLTINKSSTLSLSNNVTVADSFAVTAGTLDISTFTLTLNGNVVGGGTLTSSVTGTVNYNKGTAAQTILTANYGNLILSAFSKTFPSTVVGIAGNFTVPNPATAHITTGNTIDFNGSGAQSVTATTANFVYNNLTLSNGLSKTAAGAITVASSLSIGSSITFDGGVNVITVNGNVSNAGSITGSGGGVLQLSGGFTAHTLSSGGSYQSVTLNDANGALLSSGITVNGTLTFTNGVITTNTDTVTVLGTISRTTGHVNGWLKKSVGTGATSVIYELGDATNYTPATFAFGNVSNAGDLTVRTMNTEHPNINTSFVDITNNVNRYWETRYSNLAFDTYALTLTYVAADCDVAGNANFRLNIFNGTTWDSTTAGTRTTTTNQATGISSIGSYAIGMQDVTGAYRTKASGRWTEYWNVWERYNGSIWVAATVYPNRNDGLITISSGHTITVDTILTAATKRVDQLVIETGGQITITTGGNLRLNAGAGTDLTIYGTLKLTGTGIFSANTAAVTVTVGNGGVYEHNINSGAITTSTNATVWAWDVNSTLLISGITTTLPTSMNQTFGNVIWNCTGQTATLNLAGSPATINGSFTVLSTGSGRLGLTTTQTALTINKNFIVSGGSVCFKNGGTGNLTVSGIDSFYVTAGYVTLDSNSAATTTTVNIANYFGVTGGQVNINSVNNLANGGVINLSGNYVHTAGTVKVVATGTGSGVINFNGTSPQSFISGGTISGNVDYTVNAASYLMLGTNIVLGRNFTVSSTSTLEIGSPDGITSSGATGNIQGTGTRTYNSGANYIYNGSSAQITGVFTTSPTAFTVNDLTIDNSAGVTLSGNLTVVDSLKLLTGVLSISSQTLMLNNVALLTSGSFTSGATGTVNYNKASNGQVVLVADYGNLILSNFNKVFPSSGTVRIAGTFTKGLANPTSHTVTGSTFEFNGASQAIPKFTFENLIFSGSGTKTVDSSIIVNGNLTFSAGTVDLSTSSVILYANGNVVNNAATSGSGKVSLAGGSTMHVLSGVGFYNNLEINDALGASTSSDITVNGTLFLTNGVFGMGSNTMVIGSSGTTVQSLGYVNGKMRKTIPVSAVPQTISFEIGDAVAYAPVALTFNNVSVSGTLNVSTTGIDHPNIKYSGLDKFKDVNRYWTLTNNGIVFTNYDITLNFVAGDLDASANTNAFFAKRYNTAWFAATTVLRNSSWIKNLSNTDFGEFATGEISSVIYWTKGAGTNNWADNNNWSTNSPPTIFNDVIFDINDSIAVNIDGTTKNLTIQNDTLRLTILSGNTLTIADTLTQYNGTVSTLGAFPTVSKALFYGGTFGYDALSGGQTVSSQTYNNLRISGGGTKTADGSFTVNNILSIGSNATFADAGYIVTVKDSVINNGAHTGTGKILLNGTAVQYVYGTGTFANTELNNSNGANFRGSLSTSTIAVTTGIINTGTDSLTITNTRTGNGMIIGKVRRLHSFLPNVSYEFESPNTTLNFSSGSLPTSITVKTILDSSSVTNTYMNPINRYYEMSQVGGTGYQYKLRLHYEDSELGSANSESTPPLRLWKNDSLNVWTRMGVNSNDNVNNWVQWDSVTSVGRFSISSRTITNVTMALSANVTYPAPQDTAEYTISYSNSGDGNATNFIIVAPIPLNTSYVPASVIINGTPTSDAVLGIPINPTSININLSTLVGGASGTIVYKVIIN
ncbi:MAG: fibronectin type III domain-containing protein [Bacteroidota bacterium]